jgi:hypothetical protein
LARNETAATPKIDRRVDRRSPKEECRDQYAYNAQAHPEVEEAWGSKKHLPPYQRSLKNFRRACVDTTFPTISNFDDGS